MRKNIKNKNKEKIKKNKEEQNLIMGKNSSYEYLENGKDIQKIEIEEGKNFEKVKEKIKDLLKLNKNIDEKEREKIEKNIFKLNKNEINKYGTRHQGIVIHTKEYKYYTTEEVLKNVNIKEEKPLIVILDKIEDPNNLGSILRSSEIFGVKALIIPEHGSAKMTSVVRKVSVGGAEKVPVIKVNNINYEIDKLKELGFWIYAADMEGADNIYNLDFNIPTVLILGNEGKGVSKLTKEKSDYIFKIPMMGTLDSLNVSVSAAIAMYEVQKNRKNI